MTNETKSPAQAAPVVAASKAELPGLPKAKARLIVNQHDEYQVSEYDDKGSPVFDEQQMETYAKDYARAVLAAATPAARPTDDRLWDETLRDRDAYHEWADKLAEAIAKHFGADIGEHSNQNCPWTEALEVIEGAAPAVQQPAEGGWISVAERLPKEECLAAYVTEAGRVRRIRAKYVERFTVEAEGDDCYSEYREDGDTEYLMPGWYECIDNWGEYSSCFVNEGTVTHWQPMPAAPAAPTQAEG